MLHLILVSLVLLSSNFSSADSQAEISEEWVPIELYPTGSIKCRDPVPDRGFGGYPASLYLERRDFLDRTLRLRREIALAAVLPDGIGCNDISTDLLAIPKSLEVKRITRRVHRVIWHRTLKITELVSEYQLDIPLAFLGRSIQLTAVDHWNVAALNGSAAAPIGPIQNSDYIAHIYPQSATLGVGLYCIPSFTGEYERLLSLGRLDGNGYQSNVVTGEVLFASSAECESARFEMLTRIRAEDSENWGHRVRVQRKLETSHRFILDNQAQQTCQKIQIDTIATTFLGRTFRGSQVFPLMTVDMSNCDP